MRPSGSRWPRRARWRLAGAVFGALACSGASRPTTYPPARKGHRGLLSERNAVVEVVHRALALLRSGRRVLALRFLRLVAPDMRKPAMPRHDVEPLPLGTVVAGPFGQFKLALDIDPCALHELVRHLDCLGIECQHRNPLSTIAVAHADGQPQVFLAGRPWSSQTSPTPSRRDSRLQGPATHIDRFAALNYDANHPSDAFCRNQLAFCERPVAGSRRGSRSASCPKRPASAPPKMPVLSTFGALGALGALRSFGDK